MLFYVALLIVSILVASIIVWVYRMVASSTDRMALHHLSSANERQIIRSGVKRYAKTHKSTATRKSRKPRYTSSKQVGRNSSSKTDWGWKPNVGYPSSDRVVSGQAYKPSKQAVSTFALKINDD